MNFKKYFWFTRITLAFIWFYHGLVPKILFKSPLEIQYNDQFIPFFSQDVALYITGVLEISFALCMLAFYHARFANYIIISFGLATGVVIAIYFPESCVGAFNPISLNVAMIALSVLNLKFHEMMLQTKYASTQGGLV